MKLRCGQRMLSLDRPVIMGVLNVTPDSFSDGGLWLDRDAAVRHARAMVAAGAAIVDVGGESTRPGAVAVPEDEELRRVIPVVDALSDADVVISIDTRKARVAQLAVEAGASLVNDTLGEQSHGEIDEVAANNDVAIVVMHSRGTPSTMRSLTSYSDVVSDVAAFLRRRVDALHAVGVGADRVVVDPGFGFAKNPVQNYEMLRRLDEFVLLGYPLLVGTSRKSFIGSVLDVPAEQRVEGTIASCVWALSKGAHLFRVHDVEPVRRALDVADAIRGRRPVEGDAVTPDRIAITGLRVKTRVGVPAAERAREQVVRVDVAMGLDLAPAAATDDVSRTVDYGAVVGDIALVASSRTRKLLESLAADIADSVLQRPWVQRVAVEVAKLEPPVDEDVDSISVRIERQRS